MCGPITTVICKTKKQNFIYQLGRLLGYLSMAIILGTLGQEVLRPLTQNMKYLAIAMIGLIFLSIVVTTIISIRSTLPLANKLGEVGQKILAKSKGRPFLVGLSSVFLPCGMLYSFLLALVAVQSLPFAIIAVIGFWAGNLPGLIATPFLVQKLTSKFPSKIRYLTPTFVALIGLLVVLIRFYTPIAETGAPLCH